MEKLRKIRHKRIGKKVRGIKEKPRLCVFRSNKHIYTQIINDEEGFTLASASSLDKEFASNKEIKSSTKEGAYLVGKLIAQRAKKSGIKQVCFDRGGYNYHGRVKRLAEGAREGGLIF